MAAGAAVEEVSCHTNSSAHQNEHGSITNTNIITIIIMSITITFVIFRPGILAVTPSVFFDCLKGSGRFFSWRLASLGWFGVVC